MAQRLARRILLIGWDSADWRVLGPLVEQGDMPNLSRLISQGVVGNITSLQPMLSPMLWTSIATGKRADQHDVLGFIEPDGNGGVRPVASTTRKCKALWNILSQHGLSSNIVSWWASHPAEEIQGCIVSNLYEHVVNQKGQLPPLPPEAIFPPRLHATLEELRCRPEDLPEGVVHNFVEDLATIDQQKDDRVGMLARLIAETSTVHNAATYLAEHEPWDFLAVYYTGLDHFSHGFMRYQPPRLPTVSEEDFRHYQKVITMCCRWHDLMLGRLLELSGPETTVILLSDHGFHSDNLRPEDSEQNPQWVAPWIWHRQQGILVMKGPGLKTDERVYGASLLDITPTVLTLLGLPVAQDMDGVCLEQVFQTPPQIARIATYETPHDGDGMRRGAAPESSWDSQVQLERLAALGYIDPVPKNIQALVHHALRERWSSLGQVHFSAGRYQAAWECFEKMRAVDDTAGARVSAANCLIRLGRAEEAEKLVASVIAEKPASPMARMLLATIKLNRFAYQEGLQLLQEIENAGAYQPEVLVLIGQAYLKQRKWAEAQRTFQEAIRCDPDRADAHDGLGVTLRALGQLAEAADEHLRSIALVHDRSETHLHLGLALAANGQVDWAVRAFTMAAQLAPHSPVPHRLLARLYRRHFHDEARAQTHLELARVRSRTKDAVS